MRHGHGRRTRVFCGWLQVALAHQAVACAPPWAPEAVDGSVADAGESTDAGVDAGIPPGECLTISGELLVTDAQSLAPLAGYSCVNITGGLHIHGSDLVKLDGLAAVETVGSLSLWNNSSLVNTDGLHRLVRAGWVSIDSNAVMETARLSSLADVRGVSIQYNPALVRVDFPSVTALGSLRVIGNAQLDSLSGLAVTTVTGDVVLQANPRIRDEGSLGLLQSVGGRIWISDHPALVGLSFPLLTSALEFQVSNNISLQSLSVPLLDAANSVTVAENPVLRSVDLPGFATPLASLQVFANLQLESLSAPALTSGQYVSISRSPSLSRVDLSGLVNVDNLFLSDCVALADLDLGALEHGGQMRFTMGAGATLHLPRLRHANLVTFGGDMLGGVDAPQLKEVTETLGLGGPSLARVALPGLLRAGVLGIGAGGAEGLQLDLPLLSTLDRLDVQRSGVVSLMLPALASASFVVVGVNARLARVSLPALEACQRAVLFQNPSLVALEMSMAGTIDHLEVTENPALQEGTVGAAHVERGIFQDNPVLVTLGFPSLGSVGLLTLTRNAGLTTFDFPSLVTADALVITANPMLTGVSGLVALETVTGALSLRSNSSLGVLGLDALTAVNSLFIVDNVMLPECLALALRDRLLQENPPGVQFHEIHGNALVCP